MIRLLKRILTAALAALTILSFNACGSGESTPDDTTAAVTEETVTESETTTELTDGLPDTDMNGFVFTIHHSTAASISWVNLQLDAEGEDGEPLNDAIYRRNRYISERFNMEFKITEDTWGNNGSRLGSVVMSGDNPYDIYFLYGNQVIANIGNIADMNLLPYLALDAEYWNPRATGTFSAGGRQLAVAGNYTLSYLSSAGCFTFNKDIYSDLGIKGNPYDLVREGEWITEKLFELAAQGVADLDGDGTIGSADRVGISSESHKAFYGALINGAGIKYVDHDDEGYPAFMLNGNEKAINFMLRILDLVNANPDTYVNETTGPHSASADYTFIDSDCLFYLTRVNSLAGMREMEDDFGILPIPKGDEAQEDYITRTGVGEIAVLPRSYDEGRIENIGMLLEAMAFNSQREIVPVYKEVLLATKFTRDADSADMLDYVFGGVAFDFGSVAYEGSVSNVLMTQIFIP